MAFLQGAFRVASELPKVRMRPLTVQPSLVEQVVEAIVAEVVSGELAANARLIQDDLARAYGVSRQPVQQALLLLRNQGLIKDAPGRGLIVAPLDVAFVRHLYEIRAALDGLAAGMAARNESNQAKRDGPALIAKGRAAVKNGDLAGQIATDMAFHALVADLSGNPLIGETTAPHWLYVRRVMAEVLRDDERMPGNIWDEHAAILDAIIRGESERAEVLSHKHIANAATVFIDKLRAKQDATDLATKDRQSRRILRTA